MVLIAPDTPQATSDVVTRYPIGIRQSLRLARSARGIGHPVRQASAVWLPSISRKVPRPDAILHRLLRSATDNIRVPAGVEQDQPAGPRAYGPVDGPADRGRQRDQDHLGAFPVHAQDPVAVLFAEIADIGGSGFEDPQAEQPEHGHQREVVRVRRFPGGGEQGLELQVGEPQGR